MFRIIRYAVVLGVIGVLGYSQVLNFHLIRTNNGFHVIKKEAAAYKDTYVDTRNWQAQDPFEHPALMRAMVKDGMEDLVSNYIKPEQDEKQVDKKIHKLEKKYQTKQKQSQNQILVKIKNLFK